MTIKNLLIALLLGFCTAANAQSGLIIIESEIGGPVTTCLDTTTYSVTIENPSPFTLTEMVFDLDLPTGITYVPSSVTGGTEADITDLENPIFDIDSIFTLEIPTITFQLIASCDVIDFISGGGVIDNDVHLNFNANGSNYDDYHTSTSYIVNQPNLALLDFTNQSFTGSVGDVYDRCMTYINSGSGSLSEFTLVDIHGASTIITAVSAGTFAPGVGADTIHVTGADFTSIGNMDTLLDPGESIIICQTVEVVSCIDAESIIYYSWGCNGEDCQLLSTSANVVFPGEIPDLTLSHGNDYGTCIGVPGEFSSSITIVNEGTGTAFDIMLEIASGWVEGGVSNMYSTFDTTTLAATLNGSPMPTGFAIDTTYPGYAKPCFPIVPMRKLFVEIDSLAPGDTLVFDWEWLTCCYDYTCNSAERKHSLGWRYKPTYYNRCGQTYTDVLVTGASTRYFRQDLTGSSPDNIFSGESGTFSFENNSYEYNIPRDTDNDQFRYEIIIPPCLTYDPGTFVVQNFLETATYTPYLIETSVGGDTINFYFDDLPTPWGLWQGTTSFDLALDCGLCATGTYTVEMNIYYDPDSTCASSCILQSGCAEVDVNLICPEVCPGINFSYIDQKRKNYGEPDNDNNGIADVLGTIDFERVRTDRLTYGDTLHSYYEGVIDNTAGTDLWPYFYVYSRVLATGNRISYANNMELTVYDNSTGLYHSCEDIVIPTAVTGGTTRTFKYEFIIADLIASGCLPPGYFLDHGDSIFVNADLVVSNNPGGTIIEGTVENQLYASDIVDPAITDSAHIFGCPELLSNHSIVGYYFTNWGPNSYSTESCDEITISQNYYMSIGPCCSNYAGGNLYPFEYRHWASPSILRVQFPDSYDYVSARFNFIRTAGTFTSAASPWFDLDPVAIAGDEYTFDVSGYFGNSTDTDIDSIYFGDDGFHGTLQVTMAPNCLVEGDTAKNVGYFWEFDVVDQLVGSNTLPISNNTTQDEVIYNSPNLTLQCDLPTINVTGSTAIWDLEVGNTSISSNALNAWLGLPTISSVIADSIYDYTTGTYIYPTPTGIFPIGDINAGDFRDYRVYAHFLTCSIDSITAHLGWNCEGVPDDLDTYPCETEEITLVEIPLLPRIANYVEVEGSDTLDLCDSAVVILTVENVQLGNAFDLMVDLTLPEGMHFYPGSSELLYPLAGTYIPLTDPTLVIGNTWRYNITAASDSLDINGLDGLLDTTQNKIKIRLSVFTDCDYTSGSRIFVNSEAYAGCGILSEQITGLSEQLFILDAMPPYDASLFLTTTYITPCLGGTEVIVDIVNNGPLAFGTDDSIRITLDPFITFIDGTFDGILNPPTDPTPTISDVGGSQVLEWKLPEGLGIGDTCRFAIDIAGDAAGLDCGINQINAQIISSGTAVCATDGSLCDIDIASGDTVRNIFVYKGYLEMSGAEASATYSPPTGETIDVSFDITNSGETISSGVSTTIRFYYDTDGTGSYSLGDELINTDVITDEIPGGGAFDYSHTFDATSDYTCQIIALISTDDNPCTCVSSQIIIPVSIIDPIDTFETCTGVPTIIGTDPVTGYGYTWTPGTDLSSTGISNPIFTGTTTYPDTDTLLYIRTVDRIGCFHSDSTLIINYSIPESDAGTDQDLCDTYTTALSGNTPLGTTSGFWTQDDGPAAATFADITDPTSTLSDLIEGTYTFIWSVTNGVCDTITDTVLIHVYDPPISNAGTDQDLCATYTTLLEGNTPIGTATGEWTGTGPGPITFSDNTDPNAAISDLIEGTYTLVWTVSNGTCPPASDTLIINVYDAPVSNAGVNQEHCGIYLTNLEGNAPVGTATGTWSQYDGPGTATIADLTDPTTEISDLIEGTYQFIWTVENGTCPPALDTVVITIYNPPVSTAGPDQDLCDTYTTTLEGNAPAGTASGLWTFITGPGAVTFADATLENTSITDLVEGTYTLVWTVSNGTCPPATDTVIINVYDQPTSNAGPDQDLCNTYATTFDGNTPLGTATGEWTQISGPGIATITDPTVENTALSGLIEGAYTFVWTVSNGTCTAATDTVIINVYDQPTSNAGPDQEWCAIYEATLAGNAPLGTATGEWTMASGPAPVVFADATLPNTIATALVEGTYHLVWTVSNGTCTPASDTMSIIIYDLPTSDAGVDQDLCATYTTLLSGNTPDGTATGEWTVIDGPVSISFDDTTNPTTGISALTEGSYTLVWTVSNGICEPATDTVIINVYDAPTSDAGPNQDLCGIYETNLAANLPAGTATGIWSVVSAPTAPVFADNTSPTTLLTALTEGTYVLEWTVSNGTCTPATDLIIINVYDPPVSNAGGDQQLCATSTTDLDGNIPAGTSTGLWTQLTGPGTATIADPTDPTTTISSLVEGEYSFMWTVSNGTCPPVTDVVTISIYNTPTSNAGPDQEHCAIYTVNLAGNEPEGTASGLWTIVSGPAGAGFTDSTDPNTTLGGLTEGTYTLVWTVSNGSCDPATDTVVITIYPIPTVNFTANTIIGCAPLQVAFTNLSSPVGDECLWEFGDGTFAYGCGDILHTYSDGTFDVTLTVTANGCTGTATYEDYILVYPQPTAAFDIEPNVVDITDTDVSFTNNSENAFSFTWDFGDASANSNETHPDHTYPELGNQTYPVELIAENEIGCADTAYGTVIVEDVIIFYIPNTFTPDGNGFNDQFSPVFTAGIDPYDFNMKIFNRWGEVIFETYDPYAGWDGSYDGKIVQDGVYIWSIEFGDTSSDKRHKYKGHVTLIQ